MKISFENLRRKGFVFCFREAMKRINPFWWTKNETAINAIYAQRTYRYLRWRYKSLAQKPLDSMPTDQQTPKKIWMCWLQGFENAPLIVDKCVKQVRKYCPDYELILLDAKNMHQYVTLPQYIIDRYANGRIPHAHFSDVLRTAILVEHGGIWLDAKMLLTGTISQEILNEPLFFFQLPRPFQGPSLCSIGFIVCAKNHPMMKRQLELLCAFWKRERGLINYFMYYILFYVLVTENNEAKALFDKMLYISNVEASMLYPIQDQPFNEKQWRQICHLTPIHIIKWKIAEEQWTKEGTYLDFILRRL